jgi:hypothetical protein
MISRPNFLFIGGDRCGSKWLHRMLDSHPNILVPHLADPYYFDRFYDRGWEWYSKLFTEASAKAEVKAAGELSHDYIFSPLAAERIHRDLPGVRLIATLRHPLDKAQSAFGAGCNSGVYRGDFSDALFAYPGLREQMYYGAALEPYYRLFPADRFKIMNYDDLMDRPLWFTEQVLQFLGVTLVEGVLWEEVFNAARKPRTAAAGIVAKNLAHIARAVRAESALGYLKRSRIVRGIFYSTLEEKPRGKLRRAVFEKFRPSLDADIVKLQSLTGVDFSRWLEHERYIDIV